MTRQGNNQIMKVFTTLAIALLATTAQAAFVTFSDISATDGDEMSGFNVAGTVLGNVGGSNTLALDVDDFTIGGPAGALMVDTMSVRVIAAPGEIIRTITYGEGGEYSAATSFVAASIQLLVNGSGPAPGNFFASSSSSSWGSPIALSQTIDVSGLNLTTLIVSIGNQLFSAPDGSIFKSFGELSVETEAAALIPLPPAFLLMGAAVAALLSVGVRRSA